MQSHFHLLFHLRENNVNRVEYFCAHLQTREWGGRPSCTTPSPGSFIKKVSRERERELLTNKRRKRAQGMERKRERERQTHGVEERKGCKK